LLSLSPDSTRRKSCSLASLSFSLPPLLSPQQAAARTSVKAKAEFYGPNRGTYLVSGKFAK